jgi:hypothetical protein
METAQVRLVTSDLIARIELSDARAALQVFLQYLPYEIQVEEVKATLAKAGHPCQSVKLCINKDTNLCKVNL